MAQRRHRLTLSAATLGALLVLAVSTGCAALPGDADATPPAETAPASTTDPVTPPSVTPDDDATPSASPSATASAAPVTLPTDCTKLLTADITAALADVPLNDPAFGASGELDGGGLLCIWRDPAADTTSLVTIVQSSTAEQTEFARGELLAIAGAVCEDDADGAVRCEASWQNEQYPVTDGRAMYARDGVRIDVQYSNLWPEGFLNSVIDAIWP